MRQLTPETPPVMSCHCRRDDGGIETSILVEGQITPDPPGLSVTVEEFYPA